MVDYITVTDQPSTVSAGMPVPSGPLECTHLGLASAATPANSDTEKSILRSQANTKP
jgi:hypothetical protein